MKVRVLLTASTANLLWARSSPSKPLISAASPIDPSEVVVELDEDVLEKCFDLFDDPTLDEAIRQLAFVSEGEHQPGGPHA